VRISANQSVNLWKRACHGALYLPNLFTQSLFQTKVEPAKNCTFSCLCHRPITKQRFNTRTFVNISSVSQLTTQCMTFYTCNYYRIQVGRRIGSRAASKRPTRLSIELQQYRLYAIIWGSVTPNASSPRVLQ